jgi:hypothetical protein
MTTLTAYSAVERERRVAEQPEMEVEDPADLLAVLRGDVVAQLGEVDDGLGDGLAQALDLGLDAVRLDQALGDNQVLRVQHDRRADDDAGGNANALLDLHVEISVVSRQ